MRAAYALGGALCLLSFGCGYSDFRLPELAPAEPQVHYAWEPRDFPVLPHGAAGDADARDALNPSVVRRGRAYYNFYSGFDSRTWRTLLATSADGLTWKKEGVVLAPEPERGEAGYIAANGSAMFRDGEFRYWYQAGPKGKSRMGFARSSDGRNWRKAHFPVMDYGPRGSWDERALGDPYAIQVGRYSYLFYLGEDRARRQRLGVARSLDGEHWQKLQSNPILELGKYGSFDEMGLGEPAVWIAHGYYWMLYTGRDVRESRRLGMARSTDGVHWEKMPAVFQGSQPWDSQVICDPTIELLSDGRLGVWFGGGDRPSPDENLDGQIGVAALHAIGNDKMK
ncbi:MAG TPA: hypothetical protein VMR62_01495 [Bryobacteraceae bacterium]|jgi:predicted GH43/DUF377 family glycosyl hydrolase|nr:hypothetical protein [Bryobacteraceae bacterium]